MHLGGDGHGLGAIEGGEMRMRTRRRRTEKWELRNPFEMGYAPNGMSAGIGVPANAETEKHTAGGRGRGQDNEDEDKEDDDEDAED